MNPLAAIYGGLVALRNKMYDRGILRSRQLDWPVVSVGNIRVGGAGKTPFTIALGEILKRKGIAFDVLSRGYKRQTTGVRVVDPNGQAADFGDEPLLIAKRLEVPVIVASRRYDAGRAGELRYQSKLHLLDDGFQHRALARQFDIVLMDESDLADSLLPAGRLREPASALRRADVIVMTAEQDAARVAEFGKPVWKVRRSLRIVGPVPKRPVVFCGLAKPERFVSDLQANGIHPVETFRFSDHHRYTLDDTHVLLAAMKHNNAEGFVTTQKDLMNLGNLVHQLPWLSIPILEVELLDSEHCFQMMMGTIATRHQPRS